VGDLVEGMSLATTSGRPRRIRPVRRVLGHFDVYALTVVGEPSTFVAAGVICHNKKLQRDDP
jgi:hypothetical protein